MIQYDCRHYIGRKPCKFRRICDGCPNYDPIHKKILVIKLGALGDLLRTTTVLPALVKAYPGAQVTWITEESCLPILADLTEIDRVWATDHRITSRVLAEEFDVVLCFDKDSPAPELATIARAEMKKGFGLNARGALTALNSGSLYSLELGIDDELKFKKNQKTYQHLVHEMADLPLPSEPPRYQLRLTAEEESWGKEWFSENVKRKTRGIVLGVNPGAGRVFATKKWHPERYLEVLVKLYQKNNVIPLLLGGPDEASLITDFEAELSKLKIPVIRPGENLPLRKFFSIVAQCDGMLCGDTLAMHVAMAFGVRTVTLFLSTCSQEIELYDLGASLIGSAPCAPCYLSKCKQPSQICAESLSVDAVYELVVSHLNLGGGGPI